MTPSTQNESSATIQELIELEQRLELMMINAEESLAMINTELNIVTFNKQFQTQYTHCYGREVIKGESILNYTSVHKAETIKDIYQKTFVGEVQELQMKMLLPDNTQRTFLNRYKPAYDEKRMIIGAFVSSVTVPEKIKFGQQLAVVPNYDNDAIHEEREEKIKQSEANLKAIVENTTEGFILTDTQGIIKSFNSKAKESVFLNTGEEIQIGKHIFDFIDESRKDFFEKVILKVLNGETIQYDRSYKRKDDQTIWLHLSINPVRDEGCIKGICIVGKDITERKVAEEKMQEVIERFEMVAKATNEAIWDWDLKKGEVIRTGDGLKMLFGYKPEEVSIKDNFWEERVHPDDFREAYSKLNNYFQDSGKTICVQEYRFRRADGTYAYVYDKGYIIRNENGEAVRMIGATQDVTRQKEEEHRLKLLESVITNATDAVLITEAEPIDEPGPRIVYVNDAFTKMTGYSKEEIIGKSPRILQGPKSDKAELKRLKRYMRQGKTCEIEIINYNKSGEEFWVQMAIAPVADSTGVFTHFIAIERDVTERKKQEQAITKAIINAQELERYQIGGELHDNVNQILVGAVLALGMTKDSPITDDTVWIDKSLHYISEAIDEIRRLSHHLAPASLDEISLEASFTTLLNSVNIGHKYKIDLYVDQFEKGNISNDLQLNLYRILQEQLKNIVKYSNATSIEISLTIEIHRIKMRIFDNGIGFNTETVKRGIGISNIKKRAELFFGTFILNSSPDNGCEIIIEIPL